MPPSSRAPRQQLLSHRLSGDYSFATFANQTSRQARQSDKETPARECRNDCVLHSHLGRLRNSNSLSSTSIPLPVKTWPSRSHFLAGMRYFNLLHNHPCTCTLHHLQASSLPVTISFSFLHGSWCMALYTYRTLQLHCSLERKNPGSSRNSPPRTCLSPAAPDPSRPLVRLGTAFYFATANCSHGFQACKQYNTVDMIIIASSLFRRKTPRVPGRIPKVSRRSSQANGGWMLLLQGPACPAELPRSVADGRICLPESTIWPGLGRLRPACSESGSQSSRVIPHRNTKQLHRCCGQCTMACGPTAGKPALVP